jgi:hypothetical protein
MFLYLQWGIAWNLAQDWTNDPREPWVVSATDDDVRVLAATLTQISEQLTNSGDELAIHSSVDSPSLRWYLRDFGGASFGQALPAGTLADALITPADSAEPALGSDYIGSDFGLHRLEPGEVAPRAASETPFLDRFLEVARWWFFHESPAIIREERGILWIRADLIQAPQG